MLGSLVTSVGLPPVLVSSFLNHIALLQPVCGSQPCDTPAKIQQVAFHLYYEEKKAVMQSTNRSLTSSLIPALSEVYLSY
jgi:hypothetical protein